MHACVHYIETSKKGNASLLLLSRSTMFTCLFTREKRVISDHALGTREKVVVMHLCSFQMSFTIKHGIHVYTQDPVQIAKTLYMLYQK